jgi:hypothetical protein
VSPQAPSGPSAATLRATLDSVFASPAYRWAETPYPIRVMREWWARLGEWLTTLRTDNPMAFRLLVFGLLIALALLLAHGAWVVWQTIRNAATPSDDIDRPAPAGPRDAAWYLREADRAAAEGRVGDAMQLAFVGLALTLEAQGLLSYHASKTPAECARDARLARHDRDRLRALVRALYAHVFGGGPFGVDDYRRWRAELAGPWHAPTG